MTKGKPAYQPLTSENICEIYSLLHNEGLVSFPLTPEARSRVDALVANVEGASFGVAHYPSVEERTVAYLYFIINDHPFTDGNKRTATLVFFVLCQLHGLHERLEDYDLDALAVFLEQLEYDDHHMVIRTVARSIFQAF